MIGVGSLCGVGQEAKTMRQCTNRDRYCTSQKVDLKTAEAIDIFLLKLKALASGEQAFTFIIDDPSGNSFIENP
jgi:C4-type Zn-finger protein